MDARKIFETCQALMKERGADYGPAEEMHSQIARRWSLVLGIPIDSYTAARMLAEMKLARLDLGFKDDTALDAINYLAIATEIQSTKNELSAKRAGKWPSIG